MCTRQCEGCQMGQSSGVLSKEVAVFQRCSLIKVPLCIPAECEECNLAFGYCPLTDTRTTVIAVTWFILFYPRGHGLQSHHQRNP